MSDEILRVPSVTGSGGWEPAVMRKSADRVASELLKAMPETHRAELLKLCDPLDLLDPRHGGMLLDYLGELCPGRRLTVIHHGPTLMIRWGRRKGECRSLGLGLAAILLSVLETMETTATRSRR